jgi:hypothetical protein
MIDPVTIYSLVSVGLFVASEVLSLIPNVQANGLIHALGLLASELSSRCPVGSTQKVKALPVSTSPEVLEDLDVIMGWRP